MQYLEIYHALLEQINSGQLPPYQKLPAERQLASTFATTRNTLREALALLESNGQIFREQRRGWLISPPALQFAPLTHLNLSQCAQQQGYRLQLKSLLAKEKLADQRILARLQLPPFSHIVHIQHLAALDQHPIALIYYYLIQLDNQHLKQDYYQPQQDFTQYITFDQIQYNCHFSHMIGKPAEHLYASGGLSTIETERLFIDSNAQVQLFEHIIWRHHAVHLTGQGYCK